MRRIYSVLAIGVNPPVVCNITNTLVPVNWTFLPTLSTKEWRKPPPIAIKAERVRYPMYSARSAAATAKGALSAMAVGAALKRWAVTDDMPAGTDGLLMVNVRESS
jgi:hypothetical protein